VASLNVRLLFASNELLSVLASFTRHPMLYAPKGDSGSAGEPEEGMILLRKCRPKLGVLDQLISQESRFTPPLCNVRGSFLRV